MLDPPLIPLSFNGSGHRPVTAKIRVRFPSGGLLLGGAIAAAIVMGREVRFLPRPPFFMGMCRYRLFHLRMKEEEIPMNYRKYMQSKSWKEKRQAKLDARSGKCECKGGCTREATQVHHLHYDSLGNESLDDLQALCPKCHMQKSKVRNFYGNTHYRCCLKEGEQSPEKILPYDVWNEANFHYQMANGSGE